VTAEQTITKAELRRRKLAERDSLSSEIRDAYSKLIEEQALTILSAFEEGSIHAYMSFRSEVKTYPLIEKLLESGREVVVPYIVSDGEKKIMHHSILSNFKDLHPGEYGVPEPSVIRDADLTKLHAVIVPLCAFDGYGHRLGYGKGYYDMFLSSLPQHIKKIGLAFSMQEVDTIPAEEHDARLDMIITEQGIIHASDDA
jgi:5-formyltetrahydrofolate cyclo-ligase